MMPSHAPFLSFACPAETAAPGQYADFPRPPTPGDALQPHSAGAAAVSGNEVQSSEDQTNLEENQDGMATPANGLNAAHGINPVESWILLRPRPATMTH